MNSDETDSQQLRETIETEDQQDWWQSFVVK
jgi:hypothetical protein